MAQMGRPGLTASQKADLWRRWKHGQSLSEISRALGKNPGSIHGALSSHGGIFPTPRRRSRLVLSLAEREEISRGIVVGMSLRQLAAKLGRAPSTVSREIRRNGGEEHIVPRVLILLLRIDLAARSCAGLRSATSCSWW